MTLASVCLFRLDSEHDPDQVAWIGLLFKFYPQQDKPATIAVLFQAPGPLHHKCGVEPLSVLTGGQGRRSTAVESQGSPREVSLAGPHRPKKNLTLPILQLMPISSVCPYHFVITDT